MKAKGRPKVRVIAQGGDRGTADIGLGCPSNLFERNDDVLYICYDNDAYMNTGVQSSGTTPTVAPTAGPEPGNAFGQRKSLPLIAMAHHIPFRNRLGGQSARLEYKVEKAVGIHGACYIHVHLPCPLGWGSEPYDAIKVARTAVESGLFQLLEAEFSEITACTSVRRPQPVDDYLKLQNRLAHLFRRSATTYDSPLFRASQHPALQIVPGGCPVMENPYAITLDIGSSLAILTGSWRTERPVYVDRLPPSNHACPAGRDIQGWLYYAESGASLQRLEVTGCEQSAAPL
jgi:pyruvate/2-oxoacid:ferredoxin oxidoreductase beta subunit